MKNGKINWNIGSQGYYAIGSDIYPITLVERKKGGTLVVQFDEFEMDAGGDYFGQQKWRFIRNPNGRLMEVTWAPKRNRYQPKGGGGSVYFGQWQAKQDPHF